MREVIFDIQIDSAGGYYACAVDLPIITEANSYEELKANVREAVDCYFEGEVEFEVCLREEPRTATNEEFERVMQELFIEHVVEHELLK